jgi:membrane protein YqaA with SNARE-associated domain/membrane-associated phospholipid phosphatase
MANWVTTTTHFFMQYGILGLFILSFVEASFFPIPPYLLSIPMTLANPRLGLLYALVGVAGSVLGGFLGYAIGFRLGRPLLARMMKPAALDKLEARFSRYGGWTIAAGGLTPIPFKFFTIAAGVFRVRLISFFPASIIARSIRLFGEALLLMFYGRKVVTFLEHSFGIVNLLILSVLLILLALLWHTGLVQKKLIPWVRKISRGWSKRVTDFHRKVFVVGKFSWYLITGATLTIFGFLLFAKLASELLEKELTHFDNTVGGWIISFRSAWLTTLMNAITNLGSTGWVIGLVIIIAIIGFRFRRRLDVLGLFICVTGALISVELLKVTFHRHRPELPWLTPATGYSFPSGHSLISLALYGFLTYLVLRQRQWSHQRFWLAGGLVLLPVLIGISRVYLGVHYPSDVLGGWAVAGAWVGTCVVGIEFLNSRLRRSTTP